MVETLKKNELNGPGEVVDTLQYGAYVVYDTVLRQYSAPFVCPINELTKNISSIVNDVHSTYYGHESDYILCQNGTYNRDTGEINYVGEEKIAHLDSYIDINTRNVQTCIQTLNFLPTGYFKMPLEMQKDIQTKIDDQIKYYTETFIKTSLPANEGIADNVINSSN